MTNQRYQTIYAPENHLNSNHIFPGDPPSEAADDPKENDVNDATAELVRGPSKGGQEALKQKQERRHSRCLIFDTSPSNTTIATLT